MNFPKSILLLVAFFLILSPAAHAQTTPTATPNNVAQLLPLIYADKLTITSQDSHTLKGSFQILNREDSAAVGAITYKLLIMRPETPAVAGVLQLDNGFIYNIQDTSDTVALAAGDTQTMAFTYPLPTLPAGDYRLRVQLQTTNDRMLGWADTNFTLASGAPILNVQAATVEATSFDPITPSKTGSSWLPLYGVNVDAGQNGTLTANVTWTGQTSLTATPVINRKRLLISNAPTVRTIGGVTTFKPGETKVVSIPFKAPSQPGAYRFLVTFQNAAGQPISSLGEFRAIVRGQSASVVSAKVIQLHKQAGDTIQVQFTAVGSSDRQTTMSGHIDVAVLDGDNVIGTITSPIDLSLNAVSGTANVKLDKDLTGTPQVSLTLYGTSKTALDTYTIPLPGIPVMNAPFTLLQKIVIGFIAISILLLVTFSIISWRQKSRR